MGSSVAGIGAGIGLRHSAGISGPPGPASLVQAILDFTPFFADGRWQVPDTINPTQNPSIVDSFVLESDGGTVLTFSDLTGVSISSQSGTSVAAVDGDTITLSAGYIDDLVLSNGTHLKFAEGAGDVAYDCVGTNHTSITNGTWGTATVRPDNLIDGFSSWYIE